MANPIQYAENTLGVHAVYERCQTLQEQLKVRLKELAEDRSKKRELEAFLGDLEFELMSQEAAAHSELSQAALDRHMKMFFSKDDTHKKLRQSIREKQWNVDEAEGIIRSLETDIRVETARMTELGGYLQYLAAAKLASLSKS